MLKKLAVAALLGAVAAIGFAVILALIPGLEGLQ